MVGIDKLGMGAYNEGIQRGGQDDGRKVEESNPRVGACRAPTDGQGASYESGRSAAGASYTTGYATNNLKKGQGTRKRPLLIG